MNRLIVVTGGSKGIGKSIIEKFVSNGFDVITTSRNPADLEKLRSDISGKFPKTDLQFIASDLSKKEDVVKFAGFIKSFGRKVDVLINNAGLYVPGQVHNEPDGQLEFMINTNLYSAYYLTRELVSQMIDAKQGHIFNICSTASITPYVNGGSYCISKYALYGMTKVLREEMKPYKIKVTAVLPGATKTASWDGVNIPEERFIKPTDVADMIYSAFALSASAVVEEILLRPMDGDIS